MQQAPQNLQHTAHHSLNLIVAILAMLLVLKKTPSKSLAAYCMGVRQPALTSCSAGTRQEHMVMLPKATEQCESG